MLVAAGPPLLAIVFALGALGWLGFRLNMFLNVMTPLIMVISFSDSMQLTFAARDQLMAGKDKRTAFRNAILIVGPACVLNRALTFEFAFIAAFIGLAFRSARIGLACLPSGIFPIMAAGSVLRLLGYGLQFSGVVALTVSFGLGLSATIHFLNRMT